jgi:hypothetical protein
MISVVAVRDTMIRIVRRFVGRSGIACVLTIFMVWMLCLG